MGFFDKLLSSAKGIVDKGVDAVRDQLSSEYEYTKNQGVTKDSTKKVLGLSIPAPKIVTGARKFVIGENAQERLTRIQKERGQTLLPVVAEQAVREDFAREGVLASGGMTQRTVTIDPKIQERLTRIQEQRGQTLLPEEAERLIRDDFSNEALATVLKSASYDPTKVNAVGIPLGPAATMEKRIVDPAAKSQERRARKLQDMATGARTYNAFLKRTGITQDALDATVQKQGFNNALEYFYAKREGYAHPSPQSTQVVPTALPRTNINATPVPAPVRNPGEKFNVNSYVKQNIERREAARGGSKNLREHAGSLVKEAKTKLVDFTAPIEDTLALARKENQAFDEYLNLNPSKNIKNQIDRVLRTPTLAGQFIKDRGFDSLIKTVDDIDEFDEYLLARHAPEVESRGFTTGRNLNLDLQLVSALSPKYEEQAKVVTDYSRQLLDYITENGLISQKTNELLKELYPNYVPLKRVLHELEKDELRGASNKAVASLSSQSVVQKILGGDRAIESPIRSLLEVTNTAFQQSEKNKASQLIMEYAQLPGNPFGLRRVNKLGEVTPGQGTISALFNGKTVIYEVPPDIERAAKSLDIERLNILGRIFALPVRIARAGITGLNPSFIAANMARDQVGAFINADNGLRASVANPSNFLKGLWSAVGHDDLYEEWIRAGGGGTSYDLGRDQVVQTISRIRAGRSLPSRVAYTVKHPGELLRAVENIIGRSEELARLQHYKAARDVASEKGIPAPEAMVYGAEQSRENSTNFARRGEWGTVLNSTLLYLNASIQGSRTLLRNLQKKPVATSAKIATTLLFPTAQVTYWNLSDPERKAAYDDIQDYEKETNLIIVPPNPTKDENGRWNVIKIPLPPGVGQLANLVRRPIEQSQGMDDVRFDEIAKALTRTVSPLDVTSLNGLASNLTPQALKPTLESTTNTTFFTGQPIVYQNEEKLSPHLQVRDNTSGTAEQLANAVGASPIKTEAFIKSTFGGIAPNILNLADRAQVAVGTLPEDKVGGISVLDSISRRFQSAAGNRTERRKSDEVYDAIQVQDDDRAVTSRNAEQVYAEYQAKIANGEDGKAYLKELRSTGALDTATLEKVKELHKDTQLGRSKEHKTMMQLGVTNGARARFIYKQYQAKIANGEDGKAYLKELREKKVITDDVLEQIKELKASDV